MGIMLKQNPVTKRARFTLVRIDAHINGPLVILWQEGPFLARRKTGTTSPAKFRGGNGGNHLLRRARLEGFSKRFVTTGRPIRIESIAVFLTDVGHQYRFKIAHDEASVLLGSFSKVFYNFPAAHILWLILRMTTNAV
jgi:hypothetical protein